MYSSTVENIVNFENVYVNYGAETALEAVNLRINSDENWAILGANGSGKTTLMRLFSQDLYPNTMYTFKKEVFGKDRWDVFELRKYMGIITNDLQRRFMNHGADATAYDIVLSGFHSSLGVLKYHTFTDLERKKADEALEFLGISDIRNKPAGHMSTGQLRRCIIARAFVHSPKVFVLDEPTTGLDIKAQRDFMDVLQKLAKNHSIVLVTHNIGEIIPEITHVALIHNKTVFKQGKKRDILTSDNLSEVFGTTIDLQCKNDRYFVKP